MLIKIIRAVYALWVYGITLYIIILHKRIKKVENKINNFLLAPKQAINSLYGYIDTDTVKDRDINSTYPDFTNEKEGKCYVYHSIPLKWNTDKINKKGDEL